MDVPAPSSTPFSAPAPRLPRAPRSLLSGLLALPFLTALFLTAGCDRERGEAGARGKEPLPVLSEVPVFSLTDQNGKPFGQENLRGKPHLVAFFFTRCPSICPELMKRMRAIHAQVPPDKLDFVAISVDPENDTPEVLKAYAQKHEAAHSNWTFLTGDSKSIAHTSEEAFKVGLGGSIDEKKPHLGITHGSHFVLVDDKGQIRGYFRSSEDDAKDQVLAALSNL